MTKIRLVHLDGTKSYAIALSPDLHVPKVVTMGTRIYTYSHTQINRLVYKETEALEVFTESDFERARQNGLLI